MIRPDYMLHHLPLEELIDDCLYILEIDEKQLTRQLSMYERTLINSSKTENEIKNWESRLKHLKNRNAFFFALISRFQTFETQCLLSALRQSKLEAKNRGNSFSHGFSIFFEENALPELLIH